MKNEPQYEKEKRHTMNPMLTKIVGSLVRTAMAGIIPAMLAAGFTQSDTERIAGLIATLLVVGGWSVWEKIGARKKQLTAQAMKHPASEASVKTAIADGLAPSVMTPADVVPMLAIVPPAA